MNESRLDLLSTEFLLNVESLYTNKIAGDKNSMSVFDARKIQCYKFPLKTRWRCLTSIEPSYLLVCMWPPMDPMCLRDR